ncbi:MAG: prepilin-type N-terminal cleavage/methylation domain-containing protein [Comamonadaceae bacterium]|jgi:type IV fimbrial biogenesis protein FimT|nr:prepilin-type N-terminal cleavage/methylation domain-containing protein [Comamonadaceae bacterium]
MLKSRVGGFTLIEAVVAMTIIALLLAMAAPAFSNWMTSSRIRLTAESIQSGLQFARSEATARNGLVRFQLTDTLDSACALSNTGTNWVVNVGTANVAGGCNAAAGDAAAGILMKRPSSEGGGGTVVDGSGNAGFDGSIVFNGLGRPTPTPAGTLSIMVRGSAIEQCAEQGGPITCLYIQVTPGGQTRMCNANLASSDPQSCAYAP